MAEKAIKWGAVAPPKRKGRGGQPAVTAEAADALAAALDNAEDGEWVGYPETFDTKGKAVAATVRYRKALVEHELTEGMDDTRSRVWEDPPGTFRFALQLRPAE